MGDLMKSVYENRHNAVCHAVYLNTFHSESSPQPIFGLVGAKYTAVQRYGYFKSEEQLKLFSLDKTTYSADVV